MSLEAYTGKIKDLVITNPTPTDPKSQGDDHLRGIKKTMVDDAVRVSGSPLQQMGDKATAGENHYWDASTANQLSLKRGTPDAPGAEVLKAVNGAMGICAPVFSGINTASASITSNTATKLSVDTVQVDSAGWWDAVNKRYIPQIAGWYRVSGLASGSSSTANLQLAEATIYKNGAGYETGSYLYGAALANVADARSCVSCMVYCNGTTDYIELWGRCVGAGNLTISKFRLDIELAKIGA